MAEGLLVALAKPRLWPSSASSAQEKPNQREKFSSTVFSRSQPFPLLCLPFPMQMGTSHGSELGFAASAKPGLALAQPPRSSKPWCPPGLVLPLKVGPTSSQQEVSACLHHKIVFKVWFWAAKSQAAAGKSTSPGVFSIF